MGTALVRVKVVVRRGFTPDANPNGNARGGAVNNALFARISGPSGGALARERVDFVRARAPVVARVGRAVVHVGLARGSRVAGGARARERVDFVRARALVVARVGRAVVHVGLALGSRVAGSRAVAPAIIAGDSPNICAKGARVSVFLTGFEIAVICM